MIILIACVGKNGELGNKGDLCFKIKADLQMFKEYTTGHTVIMGRRTYDSIGKPLPYRRNIVISHNKIEGVECSECLPFTLGYLRGKGESPIYVIGGASIYEQALPFADEIILTEVDKEAEADVYFPKFDKGLYDCRTIAKGEENGISFQVKDYVRICAQRQSDC